MAQIKCEECGQMVSETAEFCPNCGCPIESVRSSTPVDGNVLNQGKSTEAESVITDYAESIRKWGNILSWCALIGYTIVGVVGVIQIPSHQPLPLFYGVLLGFFAFLIIRFVARITWAFIMLFVNMSTTLKRIELKLDKYGTN